MMLSNPQPGLTVDYESSDGLVTMRCSGEIDIATIDHFREAVVFCLERRPSRFLLDLSDVSFIASEGLRSLLHLTRSSRERNMSLDLELADQARHLIEVAGLQAVIGSGLLPKPA
jgi:anti-sigma B factor antagonist